MDENFYQAPVAEAGVQALSDGQYEFTGPENTAIDKTGRRAKIWGVISCIVGVLIIIALVVVGVAGIGSLPPAVTAAVFAFSPIGLVYLIMGWLYLTAGQQLRLVVTTEGNDVELLMRGIDKLASAFRLEVILTVIALVAGFVVGIGMAAAG